jgi:hypothetical protein
MSAPVVPTSERAGSLTDPPSGGQLRQWEALGMSRASWYLHGRPMMSAPATADKNISQEAAIDWKEVARAAWEAPGWREAALEYHRTRPAPPKTSPKASEKLLTSQREIWRAAADCIRRKAAHDALRTFLQWCDRHGVSRHDGLPIFQTIVDKELAK